MPQRTKLNIFLIIIGIVVALIIIYYFATKTPPVTTHSITYENQTIYSGSSIPLITSDDKSTVLLGTSTGILLYDTSTNTSKKLNTSIVSGLAFDGQHFIALQSDSTLFTISTDDGSLQEIGTGVSTLYDTTNGYLITVNNITCAIGGNKTPTNGKYNNIQLTIT